MEEEGDGEEEERRGNRLKEKRSLGNRLIGVPNKFREYLIHTIFKRREYEKQTSRMTCHLEYYIVVRVFLRCLQK